VHLIKELALGSPALWLDWARNADSGEIVVGVATRDGKLVTINPETWTQQNVVELDPPTPIWRVVGNHHSTPANCDFALATLNAGVIGVKVGKGVTWQHPFGSSCGAIAFARQATDGKQLVIAGGLDKTLRGIEPATGKLVWGQVFLEGVGFVDVFDIRKEILTVAGDAAGNVRCFDAFSGSMRWHAEFGQNTRFCVPLDESPDTPPRWLVGTDEKKLKVFEVTVKGASDPISSVSTSKFPWHARKISEMVNAVSIYDFASLGESETITPGELIALSNTGNECWKVTLPGSIEDLEVFPGISQESARIIVATNAGSIACVDPTVGTVADTLSLSKSPVNCVKILPESTPQRIILAAACDDGRVFLVRCE
jgi:outer membrane protein assembly factor BamB